MGGSWRRRICGRESRIGEGTSLVRQGTVARSHPRAAARKCIGRPSCPVPAGQRHLRHHGNPKQLSPPGSVGTRRGSGREAATPLSWPRVPDGTATARRLQRRIGPCHTTQIIRCTSMFDVPSSQRCSIGIPSWLSFRLPGWPQLGPTWLSSGRVRPTSANANQNWLGNDQNQHRIGHIRHDLGRSTGRRIDTRKRGL